MRMTIRAIRGCIIFIKEGDDEYGKKQSAW